MTLASSHSNCFEVIILIRPKFPFAAEIFQKFHLQKRFRIVGVGFDMNVRDNNLDF